MNKTRKISIALCSLALVLIMAMPIIFEMTKNLSIVKAEQAQSNIYDANFFSSANTYDATLTETLVKGREDGVIYNSVKYNMNVKRDNVDVSDDAPQVTFITHGLGGKASHWSNNSGNPDWDVLAPSQGSILNLLQQKASCNIYLADFTAVDNFVLWQLNDETYSLENLRSNIIDNTKHSIVIFDGYNTGQSNDYIYTQFNIMASKVVLDLQALDAKNELPRVNLIGHSRGGLTNLQYALDHPDLVDSIFSLGTPYLGSTSASIDEYIFDGAFYGEPGEEDIVNPEIYLDYMERWNNNYETLYKDINVYALGGYQSVNMLIYQLIYPYISEDLKSNLIDFSVKSFLKAFNVCITAGLSVFNNTITQEFIGNILNIIYHAVPTLENNTSIVNGITAIFDLLFHELVFNPLTFSYDLLNDGLVDLPSQLGMDRQSNNMYKGFIRHAKRFEIFGEYDLDKSSVDYLRATHNLEARDMTLLSYIVKRINMSYGVNGSPYLVVDVSTVNSPNSVSIIGYTGKNIERTLSIPETIHFGDIDKTVVAIDAEAFANNMNGEENIKEVKIPSTVKTIAAGAFCNNEYLESIVFNGAPITEIGQAAFMNCKSLTNISLPSTVVSIGDGAFSGCESLESIGQPYNLTSIGENAFNGCKALQSINLPYNLNSLGDSAFRDCESLQSINLPIGITRIEANTFSGCESLQTIGMPDNLLFIGESAFSGCESLQAITLPNNPISISDYAFSGCESLQSISFGNALTHLGNEAFGQCTALTSIYIPASVTEIGLGVFAGCNNLTTINVDSDNLTYHSQGNCIISGDTLIMGCKTSTIPACVKNIQERAFQDLTALSELSIPETVKNIEDGTFRGCSGLTFISLPLQGEGDTYAWDVFYELFNDYDYAVPVSLKTVRIINGTVIPNGAFENCSKIKLVILPDTILRIEDDAFRNCRSIERIDLPDNLTYIGASFGYCEKLVEISIPESVTIIENYAFWGCVNLHFVEILRPASMGITEIGYYFYDTGYVAIQPKLEAISVPDEESYLEYCTEPYADLYTYPSRIEYTLLNDETYSVSHVSPNIIGEVIIPETYNGKPVTKIGYGAFSGGELITSVILPKTIVEIGENAFYGCGNLSIIELQRHASMGITVINDLNLGSSELRMLEAILVPDYNSLYAYGNTYGAIDHLFVYNDFSYDYLGGTLLDDNTLSINIWEGLSEEERESIFELYIPAYVDGYPITKIADEGFAGLVNLEVVYFCSGGNIVEIGDRAFAGCTALTFIELPYSVEYIGEDAFAGTSLPSITLRSTMEVEQGAFGQDVTIYTDAASAPESWEFLNGHYVFWNCILAESRNYIEFIFGQSRGDYLGVINAPHKQGALGCEWSKNGITLIYDYHEGELIAYALDHIVDDEYYLGTKIQAFYGSMYF